MWLAVSIASIASGRSVGDQPPKVSLSARQLECLELDPAMFKSVARSGLSPIIGYRYRAASLRQGTEL
jgi:hypothetical protein